MGGGEFSPTISIAPPTCVLVEIGGCLDYFHGFGNLLDKIELAASSRLLLGDRHCLHSHCRLPASCAGCSVHLGKPNSLGNALAPLPIELLQSAQEALTTLHGLGLYTLGDVLRLPADGFARRFGQALLDEIRRALGELPDPQRAFTPPTRYQNSVELPAPVWEMEPLLFVANRLLLELCGFLRARGAGVTRLELELLHEDAHPARSRPGSHPRRGAHAARAARAADADQTRRSRRSGEPDCRGDRSSGFGGR